MDNNNGPRSQNKPNICHSYVNPHHEVVGSKLCLFFFIWHRFILPLSKIFKPQSVKEKCPDRTTFISLMVITGFWKQFLTKKKFFFCSRYVWRHSALTHVSLFFFRAHVSKLYFCKLSIESSLPSKFVMSQNHTYILNCELRWVHRGCILVIHVVNVCSQLRYKTESLLQQPGLISVQALYCMYSPLALLCLCCLYPAGIIIKHKHKKNIKHIFVWRKYNCNLNLRPPSFSTVISVSTLYHPYMNCSSSSFSSKYRGVTPEILVSRANVTGNSTPGKMTERPNWEKAFLIAAWWPLEGPWNPTSSPFTQRTHIQDFNPGDRDVRPAWKQVSPVIYFCA